MINLNGMRELAQYIWNISLDLFCGEVEFVASSEIILANVKGIKGLRKILFLGQQIAKYFTYLPIWKQSQLHQPTILMQEMVNKGSGSKMSNLVFDIFGILYGSPRIEQAAHLKKWGWPHFVIWLCLGALWLIQLWQNWLHGWSLSPPSPEKHSDEAISSFPLWTRRRLEEDAGQNCFVDGNGKKW